MADRFPNSQRSLTRALPPRWFHDVWRKRAARCACRLLLKAPPQSPRPADAQARFGLALSFWAGALFEVAQPSHLIIFPGAGLCARSLRRSRRPRMIAAVEFLRTKTVLTFHPALPMRAVLVAGTAAALGLLALANLSTPAPRVASVDKTISARAPLAASVAHDPLALAGQ